MASALETNVMPLYYYYQLRRRVRLSSATRAANGRLARRVGGALSGERHYAALSE